jgi:hypothetical protein
MLSSVECLFAPQNLFKHRFQKLEQQKFVVTITFPLVRGPTF